MAVFSDLKDNYKTNLAVTDGGNDKSSICRSVEYGIYCSSSFRLWQLILLAMIFQMINAKKHGDTENLLFSPNGIAGFIFYGFLVFTIALFMTGHKTPGNVMIILFLGIPVLLFVFKEPLGQMIEGKKVEIEGGVGMFFIQGFFELFETMLSFFSNTISLCVSELLLSVMQQ